jgi:Putative MetA-pathway of phenol degradation
MRDAGCDTARGARDPLPQAVSHPTSRSPHPALFLILLASSPLGAQAPSDPHEVQPERPTVATHAGTVAPGWAELEGGVELDGVGEGTHTFSTPSNLKLGLAHRTQLNVLASWIRNSGNGSATSGLSDVTLALKWRIADSLPALARFAILPSIKFPVGSRSHGTGTGTTDAGLLLISSHSLGTAEVDVNLGYTRRSGNGSEAPRESTVWTISAGVPLMAVLGWVGEVYGFPGTSGPAGRAPVVAFLTGPTVQPYRWLAIDAGTIIPVAGPQQHSLYAGFVWNLGRLW